MTAENSPPITPSARSSSGLPVRKSLVSSSSLSPGKGLTRAKAIRRISKKHKAADGELAKLRIDKWHASKGVCQGCGEPMDQMDWHCHHRLLRSRGGKHTWRNLVALHPACHEWVHAHPEIATSLGFILPTGADPDQAPMWEWTLRDLVKASA